MAALTRNQSAPYCLSTKLLVFDLYLNVLRCLFSRNSIAEIENIKFHAGKDLSKPRVPSSSQAPRNAIMADSVSARVKATKTLKPIQFCSAALLIILSGDVCPNPGWCNSGLQQPGLKVAHLNIRSLPKHLDELRILVQENPFDVLCLNETWLNSSWRDAELSISGYNIIRKDRKDEQRGGGTAIYYKSKFVARPRPDIDSDGVETVWLEIIFPNKSKLLISSLYRPPNVDLKDLSPKIESLLDYSSRENIETMLLGDLNCDLTAKKRSTDTKDLCKLFNIYQFTQLIKSPTRITQHSSTTLDLIFTTNTEKIINFGVLNCSISDHSLVYAIRRAKIPRGPIKTVKCRNFKDYSTENFIADLHSTPWDGVDTSLTVNESWSCFKDTLVKISNKHAPTYTRRIRSNTLPWVTPQIRSLIVQRNFHHKKALKSGSDRDWSSYRDLRNRVTSSIREAKKLYYSKLIEENKSDSSKLWKALKSAISTDVRDTYIQSLDVDGTVTTDPLSIAAKFGTFFRTVIARLRETLLTTSTFPLPRCLQVSPTAVFRLSPISEEFVLKQLKAIKSNKSTGFVDIPAHLLKDGAEVLAKPLTVLMNRSIAEGAVPSEWKHAMVTPIHKSGARTDPSNYRPISVLPVFSKILERAVHQMVYSYLQQHKLLSYLQSGFRPLHSTTTCLTNMTNTILNNIDNGLLTGLVFLDLSKAFDTLDHNLLLDKLYAFGFNRSAVQWFKSYLSDRSQSVCINGISSDHEPVSFGVPQGSVLGPLLFIMYVNDLPRAVNNCNIELYADDTLLYFASKSVSTIESNLNLDLLNVIHWLRANFLSLNIDKTKMMLIGTHQRLATVSNFTVQANGHNIERVNKFKYLGVVVDQNLSWKDHIEYIGKKISSRLGMLRRARKVLPRHACITLYCAMVLPLFDYCCSVWDSCGVGNKAYLDKLHRRAASIIEGRIVEYADLPNTFSWPNLQKRRDYLKSILVFKSINGLAPAYLIGEFKHAREIHSYRTRHRDLLRIPLAKTTKYQGSFRINGARTFNQLPLEIRQSLTLKEFKTKAKQHFKR